MHEVLRGLAVDMQTRVCRMRGWIVRATWRWNLVIADSVSRSILGLRVVEGRVSSHLNVCVLLLLSAARTWRDPFCYDCHVRKSL